MYIEGIITSRYWCLMAFLILASFGRGFGFYGTREINCSLTNGFKELFCNILVNYLKAPPEGLGNLNFILAIDDFGISSKKPPDSIV